MSEEIEQARREGYQRGQGVALFWTFAFTVFYVSAWSAAELPRYRAIFESVKVPMPGMTVLVLGSYGVMAGLLMLGVVASAFLTFSRKSPRSAVLNGCFLVIVLAWTTLSAIAMKLPFLSLVEGVSRGR